MRIKRLLSNKILRLIFLFIIVMGMTDLFFFIRGSKAYIEVSVTMLIFISLGIGIVIGILDEFRNINKYKKLQQDFIEYIELWMHEVKLPIAASKMIIENNKSPVTKSIDEELDKMADYIEQALFYARSNTVEQDFHIKKCSLEDIVNTAVKKGKNTLIANNVKIDIHDVSQTVNTDSKWLVFILHQIIGNSVKYGKKENIAIEISAAEKDDRVALHIKDNGIGIKEEEVSKVFDKGFVRHKQQIKRQQEVNRSWTAPLQKTVR